MKIKFSKMHGLGNDFMLIDAINQQVNLSAAQIRSMADRHFGVGFDQLLLVERPRQTDAEFQYRIFNSDGGEVEQCGNGARCFARFVVDHGLTQNSEILVDTNSGRIRLQLMDDGQVRVDMGQPVFEPAQIPLQLNPSIRYKIELKQEVIEFGAVSIGNPHMVILVDDVSQARVQALGAVLEKHPVFPQRANIGFMQVLNREQIKLRVFE
ncbi:MAG: diaminopimelate epimerase, partial [Thiohalomonadales bacterium]